MCSYATRGRPEAWGIPIPPLVVEVGAPLRGAAGRR